MVPFRQASQSPDHEKPMALRFRSSYNPVMTSINKNTRDSETYSQPLARYPTGRLRTPETGENKEVAFYRGLRIIGLRVCLTHPNRRAKLGQN